MGDQLVIALLAAAALTATPKQPTFLRCVAWNKALDGQIEHYVELSGKVAMIDGEPYDVEDGPTQYVLTRRLTTVGAMLRGKPSTVRINRLTGAYMILEADATVDEWTRPNDAGCVRVKRKF